MARIAVIGVPMDLGGRRRGTDMGPSAIRYAGLHEVLAELGHEVADLGNVTVAIRDTRAAGEPTVKFLPEIVKVCEELADRVEAVARDGWLPLILGGDHSIAIGTVGGLVRVRPEMGVIWLDAHGDFNTPETTPSGSVHGMPLAALVGRGHPALVECCGRNPKIAEERAVLVGVRELDPLEREALRGSRVTVFTMKEVDERGIAPVMREAVRVASDGGRLPVHVTVDMDVVDPAHAPGVGTPEIGGLTYREAHLAMEIVAEAQVMGSLEVTEVNPILDEGNRTALLAVGLAASALGRRIL